MICGPRRMTIAELDGKRLSMETELLDFDRIECEDSLYMFLRRG